MPMSLARDGSACSSGSRSSVRKPQNPAKAKEASIQCDSRGIPGYIGGDSLRSVFTIDDKIPAISRQEDERCIPPNPHGEEQTSHGSWVWDITELPRVPQHAPLERTALRLRDIPLRTIASRISDFMRLNSISCSYHTEDGRVDCLTEFCLKFVVQLWQDDSSIILEAQRRRGCAIAMQRIRKCLHNSLESETPVLGACYHITFRRPSHVLEKQICDELNTMDEMHTKQFRSDARLCVEFLESEKKDENRLGIESLLGLTDPSKVCRKDAEEVARALLYNEGNLASRLRSSFKAFLGADPVGDADWSLPDSDRPDDDSLMEFSQSYIVGDTHLLALKVLSNCLDLIACHEQDYLSNEATLIHLGSPFWHKILNVLVFNLRESSHRPQEAALSAKCIRILECLEPEVLAQFIADIVVPLLKSAHEFGKAHHLFLEKESEELLQSL